MHDIDLHLSEIRQVAAHIVEQDREIVHADRIEKREFARERAARFGIEAAINLIGAEPHTEAHA